LQHFTRLTQLELWQIRGLVDISFIASLGSLERLKLESLPHITALPDLHNLSNLHRIELFNMKGLCDLDALSTAPHLTDLRHVAAQDFNPKDYEQLLDKPSLHNIEVGFGSLRKNSALATMIEAKGKNSSVSI
jgi:hypothetical protein